MTKGEVDLRVINGARIVALAVRTHVLTLPFGLILELNICYHIPTISRNIISNSCLDKKGFTINDKNYSLYMDNVSTLMYL